MIYLRRGSPALILAPMEGVTDFPMRALLSERGGFTFCVTEFFRISQDVPGIRALIQHVPELKTGCKTATGTPVQLQFLGGNPEKMAEAALRAVQAGARAVDINFGCPAPTVNRNDGGATLLKYPLRIRAITEAIRKALPVEVPVSAKLRLGWDSIDPIHENAEMAAQGGASWITIHGRTKTQGYTPPAYWLPIGEVQRRLNIPVVANGEIWTLDDFHRCREQTSSEHFMIGRSAMANPLLQHQIAKELGLQNDVPEELNWIELFERFSEVSLLYTQSQNYTFRRVKQWISMITWKHKLADLELLKRTNSFEELIGILRGRGGRISEHNLNTSIQRDQ